MNRSPPFRLGVNYWPARTAMGWWSSFEPLEASLDFARIAECGFDSVRIFLTWEAFQPTASAVDAGMIRRLVTTLDLASEAGLVVMPTLFTGHMSGVNWIPPWALGGDAGDHRFRVISEGRVAEARLASWYADPAIVRAQEMLASEVADALAGHGALFAWDLGNENSNCVVPPDKASGLEWLSRMTTAIRVADPRARITIGLHMEDLVEDRNLGPREAASVCDFLTMHGYPGYAPWADGPTDERLLPFLTRVTRWLAGGAEVMFTEFGVPTVPLHGTDRAPSTSARVGEEQAASYTRRALSALRGSGASGAMLWCYADYAEAIWDQPPLDLAVHERSFGLWRADASPKPAVEAVRAFSRGATAHTADVLPEDATWIDVDPGSFYGDRDALPRLFRRYCAALKNAR